MAVDLVEVCSLAAENQSSNQIAIGLLVVFSIYTLLAIALTALTIYATARKATLAPPARPTTLSEHQLCLVGSNVGVSDAAAVGTPFLTLPTLRI